MPGRALRRPWDTVGIVADPPDAALTIRRQNTEAAPSTETLSHLGSESSGNVAKQDAPEQKPVNLGGLSTNELLQRVKESPTDPDTLRALKSRLKRLVPKARPQRERSQKAQRAAADEGRTAVSGLKKTTTQSCQPPRAVQQAGRSRPQ